MEPSGTFQLFKKFYKESYHKPYKIAQRGEIKEVFKTF